MTRTRDSEHVISQGTFRDGSARVDYYTTTPAPSQWIAVGVLMFGNASAVVDHRRRLIVGSGTSERQAVADLRSQFRTAVEAHRERCAMIHGASATESTESDKEKRAITGDIYTGDSQMAEDDPTVLH
jgi:hypothetical protein